MVTPLAVVDRNATQISGTLTVLGRVKSGEERARLARVSAAARVALNATRSLAQWGGLGVGGVGGGRAGGERDDCEQLGHSRGRRTFMGLPTP